MPYSRIRIPVRCYNQKQSPERVESLIQFAHISVWVIFLVPLSYKEDQTELVWHLQGTRKYLGHLDGAGNFKGEDTVGFALDGPPAMGNARQARLTNFPANGTSELVYEYRSGRLVKGTLIKDGHFVPERGSEIISFEQYIPLKGNLRIYNLPGRFVERAQKKRN